MRSKTITGFAGALSVGLCVLSIAACSSRDSPATPAFSSQIELAEARMDCLLDKGWPVELNSDGQIVAIVPEAQLDRYKQDDSDCLEEVGVDVDRDLTEQEWSFIYEAHVEGSECLEALGFEISPTPSIATFRESYGADPWLPWAEVPEAQVGSALASCPMPGPTF